MFSAEHHRPPMAADGETNQPMTSTSLLAEYRQVGIANTLRRCELFAGMPPNELNTIAEITVVKSLDKGQYLFRQSDSAHGFFIVQNGAINVHRVNSSGREQVLH